MHSNILVWGRSYEEHRVNLAAHLQHFTEKGVTLKLSKSTFCMNEIHWFGRTFTPFGVRVDTKKTKVIIEQRRPQSLEDVRSFLMACQHIMPNLLLRLPSLSDIYEIYEELTAPLCNLLKKNTKFHCGSEEEQAYSNLIQVMSSTTTLRPYNPSKATYFVSDASPVGIQASLYQEEANYTSVPVDHTSRALTQQNQTTAPSKKRALPWHRKWGNSDTIYLEENSQAGVIMGH